MAKRKAAQQAESIQQASAKCKAALDLYTKDIGAGYPRQVLNLPAVIEILKNYGAACFENRLATGLSSDMVAREVRALIQDEIIGGFGSHRLFEYDWRQVRYQIWHTLNRMSEQAASAPTKASPELRKARQQAITRKLHSNGQSWAGVRNAAGLKPYAEETIRRACADDLRGSSPETRKKILEYLGVSEQEWYDVGYIKSLKF
jgi:hypothetical protein